MRDAVGQSGSIGILPGGYFARLLERKDDQMLSCAQAGCGDTATHVCVQGHDLALLFKSGAGVLCAKHARSFDVVGGVSVSLKDYAELATRTTAA